MMLGPAIHLSQLSLGYANQQVLMPFDHAFAAG